MSWRIGGSTVGYDNRAAGSPAGEENTAVANPPPSVPAETGKYGPTVSATIARSGITATVTATAHLMVVGDTVRIAGATQLAYNGDKAVLTAADADTLTYDAHGSPTSPATGTITVQKRRIT